MQFDHIGVVAGTLAEGRAALDSLIEVNRWTQEFTDPIHRVHIQFGMDSSGVCYELIAPSEGDSPVAKTLRSGKHTLNHVAYLVPDLALAAERMRAMGGVPTSDAHPAVAYGGKRIQFFTTRLRLLIELIEAPGHQHEFNRSYKA